MRLLITDFATFKRAAAEVRNARESVGFCCTAAKETECHKPT
jgi:hypothetical protein